MDPTVHVYAERLGKSEKWTTYIGYCCREWVLAAMCPVGRCGICGEVPEYLRPDE